MSPEKDDQPTQVEPPLESNTPTHSEVHIVAGNASLEVEVKREDENEEEIEKQDSCRQSLKEDMLKKIALCQQLSNSRLFNVLMRYKSLFSGIMPWIMINMYYSTTLFGPLKSSHVFFIEYFPNIQTNTS